MEDLQQLISRFIKPPSGSSPEAITERLLYWVERANHPEKYSQDNSKFAIADMRRKGRQNVRRIVTRYPEIAAALAREQERQ